MQDCIKMNGIEIWQPDSGLTYPFETTYAADSGRVISGVNHATPLFTVEQLGYTATDVPVEEVRKILQIIIHGYPFTLHYFSLYYCAWRDGLFRVGKGDCSIMSLKNGEETVETLSFNMTGENPI